AAGTAAGHGGGVLELLAGAAGRGGGAGGGDAVRGVRRAAAVRTGRHAPDHLPRTAGRRRPAPGRRRLRPALGAGLAPRGRRLRAAGVRAYRPGGAGRQRLVHRARHGALPAHAPARWRARRGRSDRALGARAAAGAGAVPQRTGGGRFHVWILRLAARPDARACPRRRHQLVPFDDGAGAGGGRRHLRLDQQRFGARTGLAAAHAGAGALLRAAAPRAHGAATGGRGGGPLRRPLRQPAPQREHHREGDGGAAAAGGGGRRGRAARHRRWPCAALDRGGWPGVPGSGRAGADRVPPGRGRAHRRLPRRRRARLVRARAGLARHPLPAADDRAGRRDLAAGAGRRLAASWPARPGRARRAQRRVLDAGVGAGLAGLLRRPAVVRTAHHGRPGRGVLRLSRHAAHGAAVVGAAAVRAGGGGPLAPACGLGRARLEPRPQAAARGRGPGMAAGRGSAVAMEPGRLEAVMAAPPGPPSLPPVPVPAPVDAGRRIHVLDALRGFALLGIFLMNIEWFTRPPQHMGQGLDPSATGIDRIAALGVYVLVQGKFWVLFSLLFGMGFALMSGRHGGPAFQRVYLRRCLALLGFGLAHGLLLWNGDILHAYAIAGLLLVALDGIPRRRWPWLGAGLYLGMAAGVAAYGLVLDLAQPGLQQEFVDMAAEYEAGAAAAAAALSRGSWAQAVRENAHAFLTL